MTQHPQDERPLANRLEILGALRTVDWPASRGDLVERAREQGASEAALHALAGLPDRRFGSAREVGDAIGGDIPSSGMQGGMPLEGEPQAEQAQPARVGDAEDAVSPLPGATLGG